MSTRTGKAGTNGPHQGQRVFASGVPLDRAERALILVHGRGATAQSILPLADEFEQMGFAHLAPQAAGNAWYPHSFLAPLASNEPWLSSALAVLDALVQHVQDTGIPPERMVLGGFSQGACLTLEFVARNARRYGGVFAFSGGVIGPPGMLRDYEGSLEATPVFIGCSDVDVHIPLARVHETKAVFEALDGAVTSRVYPGMGHTINQDEIGHVRRMMAAIDGTGSHIEGMQGVR